MLGVMGIWLKAELNALLGFDSGEEKLIVSTSSTGQDYSTRGPC